MAKIRRFQKIFNIQNDETLNIRYSVSKNGFRIKIDTNSYAIKYPPLIWNSFPNKIKKSIIENFVFLSTFTLPVILNRRKTYFDMTSPLLASFFVKPILYYIPSCADENNRDSFSLFTKFMNASYDFKSYNIRHYDYFPKVYNRSMHLFTFGKDSLLGYAIAEEIGLNPVLLYVEEPDTNYIDSKTGKIEKSYENKHKDVLIKKFTEEFKKQILKIKHELSLIRHSYHFGIEEPDLPYGSQLTEYALLSIPFNNYYKTKYLVYGNEASCSKTYLNKDGLRTNPVFDQSGEWVVEISKMLRLITNNISAVSLIEPIHDIAIIRILFNRYPQYAKYQMSCFANSGKARYSRCCHVCSKCARIYVLLKANNIDPAIIGYKENMFKKDKMHLYSLFGTDGDNTLPYDLAGVGRDEMLLAFYLAFKNGAKGYLINLFKEKFLKEAENKKEELYGEFFGIHDSLTIPKYLHKKVINIYKEELENMNLP
jgi:hypothetical protein